MQKFLQVYNAFYMTIQLKTTLFLFLFGATAISSTAQEQELTLNQCITLALQNNRKIQISQAETTKAHYERKVAFTNYFPRINAIGAYFHNSERVSLLKNNQKTFLQNIGTELQSGITPLLNELAIRFPELSNIISSIAQTEIEKPLNNLGSAISESFTPDTRNTYGAIISLTQPLYMGGRITAYNKIAKLAEKIAESNIETTRQETILNVNETYWLIVSIANKKRLAESYLKLTEKLHSDVESMQAEGVATMSDVLGTSVKKNEATLSLLQVTDALKLTRMLLCKLCGIPLEHKITLADENSNIIESRDYFVPTYTDSIKRSELYSLQLATYIYDEERKITISDYLPQFALTANLITAYPDFTNGFEKKFCSTWNIGLTARIPLWNWGEGYKKAKAAKAKADISRYKLEDVREEIELEVKQARLQTDIAFQRLKLTNNNIKKAEENLHMAEQAFSEGMLTSDKVMEAQTAWLQAHSENIDAEIEIIMSHIRLQRALGILK